MNVAPSIIRTMLASRSKDMICAVEFYDPSYVPHAVHGFWPASAIARFATETTAFTYTGPVTSNYVREVMEMPSLSRVKGKQSNTVTIRLSNVPRADAPTIRPLADFVLNNEVEGLRVVIRILSRAHLSSGATSPAALSFIAFVGKCSRPNGFDRQSGTITARQDLGQITAQIPPRVFQKICPLDFGGPECLGTELLTEKNAAYQAAFAALGRHGCDKTKARCIEFENMEFRQGIETVQIQGSFIHRPHEGFLEKVIGLLTPGSGKRRMRVGNSVQDGTPWGRAIPAVLGRAQMSGIPLQFQDIGTSINFLVAWCRGPIAAIYNIHTSTLNFSQPLTVTHHYGRYGGEANQGADTVFPQGGFFSRLAYSTGHCLGSDIATEEAAPEIKSMIAGSAIDVMDTIHLMNRCGSGRVNGGGMAYAGIFGGQWTDNPVELTRIILTDDGLLGLDPNFIETRRTAITSHYCHGAIKDDTNAERLLLPDTETSRAGVDYHRYNSTGMITPYGWHVAVSQFPIPHPAYEATYEFFDPDDPPLPEDIPVKTIYRRRYTGNLLLTEQRKALDVIEDTLLPSFRGFFSWNWKGQLAIRSERPADSTLLRVEASAGASTVEVYDVVPYKKDINEIASGQLEGQLLIGVGLLTSEVRGVTSAAYNGTAGDAITLAASATGGTTATASGATLSGGSSSAQSHGTITIGGTLAEGDTVTAIIDGIESTYTLQADETADTVAAALGFAINANLISQRYVEADNGGWNDYVDIYSKVGTLTLSSELEEEHDAAEETIRVMMSFADQALTYANATRSNIIDGTFKYLGSAGETRYNQFKGTHVVPIHDFAEQTLIVNDYDHQERNETKTLEIDLSAVDSHNQASRLLNGAASKFGDGVDFFSWGSNGLALQLEEGDVVCVSHPAGLFRNVPVTIESLSWDKDYTVTFEKARIYSTSFYNDTVQQTDVTIPSGLTNFAAAPPAPTGLTLTSVQTAGTFDSRITGSITTANFLYGQRALVYVTPPGGTEVLAQTLAPGETEFSVPAPASGTYEIRVVAVSLLGKPGGEISDTIDVVNGAESLFSMKFARLLFEFGDGKNSTSLEADQTSRFSDVPAGTITKVRIEGDTTGSAVVDIQTSTADPPSYSSICASAKPTLSSDAFAEDTTLTGWTTAITEGTKSRAVLESVSGMKQVTVVLTINRS